MSKRRQTKPLPPITYGVRMYTDGSAYIKTRLGGWGLYIVTPNGEERFFKGREKGTTISRMEMVAMEKALALCLKLSPLGCIDIYSDSAMVVNSINEKWINNWARERFVGRKNSDIWVSIWNHLKQLRKGEVSFKVHHINGHLKDLSHPHIFGNHVADILADYKSK